MKRGDYEHVWQASDWPGWRYDLAALARPLADASRAQGLLMGRLADVGMALRDQASLSALTDDVVKTSEIEGEKLDVESVRSSIARRLGVDIGALAAVDRHVEGVVEMVLDATANCDAPVTRERLFGWHAALFPTGYSGLARIRVGGWRDDASGPMQVVSGPVGRRRAHFEAPPADRLEAETSRFLDRLVPRRPAPRGRSGTARARRRSGEGAVLAALRGHADERTTGQAAQPVAGRVRRQAHDKQVGGDREVLAGYGVARHR